MAFFRPFEFARLSEKEMRPLDFEVMGCVFEAHNTLGNLCDEAIYQTWLAATLREAGFDVETEVGLKVSFRSFIKPLYLDLVVNRSAIYELKTVTSLAPIHQAQLINYLFITNGARGKLVNFRPQSVQSQFVNSAMDDVERRRFSVDLRNWAGDSIFEELMVEMVSDWGTGLDRSLYSQAAVHCLGGEEKVVRMVPMMAKGRFLGNQRFHLLNEGTAFQITTFQDGELEQRKTQMKRLLGCV